MATTFKNPANGYAETVGGQQSLFAFLFGAVYLAIRGLWGHVFLWLAIVFPITIVSGGPGIIILLPIASIIYASTIQSILCNKYRREGWIEDIQTMQPTLPSQSTQKVTVVPVGLQHVVRVLGEDPAEETEAKSTHKTCPFCAEDVLAAAIKCKHCGSELASAVS